MGASKLIITGKIGPGNTITSTSFTNVTSFTFDAVQNVITINCDQGQGIAVDVRAATGWATTFSGNVLTMTIT